MQETYGNLRQMQRDAAPACRCLSMAMCGLTCTNAANADRRE
jgi:hypothetical protein